MGIALYDWSALERAKIKNACFFLDLAPPLGCKLTAVKITLRDTCQKASLRINNPTEPSRRGLLLAKQALEALHLHGDGKFTKWLPIPEDRDLNRSDPGLRKRPQDDLVGDD